MTDRVSVLVVAGARTAWSAAVARWAADAVLPVEVTRCVSVGEVHARLDGTRRWSALLADAHLHGVDRDLVAAARDATCPTVLVTEHVAADDIRDLGAAAVLAAPFSRDELLAALDRHARPLAPSDVDVLPVPRDPTTTELGSLVAVLGAGGSGTSVVAAATAQGLGRGTGRRRDTAAGHDVLLADLCRRADQGLLHDVRDLACGLREVVDAHRTRTPAPTDLRDQTVHLADRGYHLLPGLRRAPHWTALPRRAVDAALDGLRAAFELIVADLDPDLEDEAGTGSFDVEDRHHLTRATLARADLVVVTLDPSALGCAKAVRLVAEVVTAGVPPERLLLVCTRAPRSPRARAEVARTLADLLAGHLGPAAARIAAPLGVPDRPVDTAVRDVLPFPSPLPDKLAAAVTALLERHAAAAPAELAPPVTAVPVPVRPGELDLGDLDLDDEVGT